MKRRFISFIFAIFALTAFSQVEISLSGGSDEPYVAEKQEPIDVCMLRAQYRMEYVENVKYPSAKRNQFMLLQMGKKVSKFSDYFRLKADALSVEYEKKKMKSSEVGDKGRDYFSGTLALNVFKNFPRGKITVIDRAFLVGNFKYTEEHITFIWKTQEGTDTICGYVCNKATTTFRGRNYTAWYATKIPFSDGPWKFSGLPGLILKVSDDRNEYLFECVAVEKGKEKEIIYIKESEYFNTTRDQFNKTAKRARENPTPYVESLGVKPMPNKSMPYNPIELE